MRGLASPSDPSGTMIFDNAAHDTFAHELGHFLLDQHATPVMSSTPHVTMI